jgi:uncharacterized protein (DUF302 family)
MIRDFFRLVVLGVVLGGSVSADEAHVIGPAHVYETWGDYETVRAFLLSEIRERGLVINRIGDVNSMLGRTAGAVGATVTVYRNAEAILFCKADLSHNLTALNPHNIVLCPYSISIYETKAAPGAIYLSYRYDSADHPAVKLIARLLDEIILQVIEM